MKHLKLEGDFLKVPGKGAMMQKKKRENSEIKYHGFQECPELPGLLPLGSSEQMAEDTIEGGWSRPGDDSDVLDFCLSLEFLFACLSQ